VHHHGHAIAHQNAVDVRRGDPRERSNNHNR
jgi:hypothetical protein